MQMTSPHNPEASAPLALARAAQPGVIDTLGRRALLAKLQALNHGCLVLVEGKDSGGTTYKGKVFMKKTDAGWLYDRESLDAVY